MLQLWSVVKGAGQCVKELLMFFSASFGVDII